MPYEPTDGFLRLGADQEGLGRADGLLYPSGPDTGGGGPPPPIFAAGTVTTVSVFATDAALADIGELAVTAAAIADAALADIGDVTSTAAFDATQVIAEGESPPPPAPPPSYGGSRRPLVPVRVVTRLRLRGHATIRIQASGVLSVDHEPADELAVLALL
jgi:hypothetical protein